MLNFCFPPDWFVAPAAAIDSQTTVKAIVHSAQPQDIKELAALLTHCFHPPQGWLSCFHPLITLGVHEDLRTRLRQPPSQYRCLVASMPLTGGNGREIVGTVEISQRRNFWQGTPLPYIANLAVKTSHRRQGIARQLLLRCEQVASEWGCGELTLHVLEDNRAAKQLYLASGYQIQRCEPSLSSLLWQQPQRLLLQKPVL
jgi:GNAT superfamily N-acetyltransferase